eukprot:211896-Chlamydomonas_euryale.AAC.1
MLHANQSAAYRLADAFDEQEHAQPPPAPPAATADAWGGGGGMTGQYPAPPPLPSVPHRCRAPPVLS